LPSASEYSILKDKTHLLAYFRAMKWIFGLFSLAILCASCDNELVVTDQWKDIPVVWGMISKSDTAIYIRVEKAYLDPTTSALDIARIPDSLYYEDAIVQLKRISSGQVFNLRRVDGNLEGYPRDSGIFAEAPNYLYKIKANEIALAVGEKYQLIIQRNDHTPLVTGQTIILPKPVLRVPNPGSDCNFKPNQLFTFSWNPIENAGIFDLHVIFHYDERSPSTGNVYEHQSFDWVVTRNLEDREFKIDGVEFYNTVAANIEEDINATRRFDSLDIQVWCAGLELKEYISIIQANGGITSTQDIPSYTNLSEGIGIFTSRNLGNYTGFGLTPATLDSLANGSITGDLNFQ
jgi:hypothetical protein